MGAIVPPQKNNKQTKTTNKTIYIYDKKPSALIFNDDITLEFE